MSLMYKVLQQQKPEIVANPIEEPTSNHSWPKMIALITATIGVTWFISAGHASKASDTIIAMLPAYLTENLSKSPEADLKEKEKSQSLKVAKKNTRKKESAEKTIKKASPSKTASTSINIKKNSNTAKKITVSKQNTKPKNQVIKQTTVAKAKASVPSNLSRKQQLIQRLEENPNSIKHRNLLAILYANKSKFDKAIDVLDKGLKIQPKNVSLTLGKVDMLLQQKKLKKAEDLIKTIKPVDQVHKTDFHTLSAQINIKNKNYEKASHHYKEALKNTPRNPFLWDALSKTLSAQGMHVAAEQAKTHAQAMPDLPSLDLLPLDSGNAL